MVAKKGKITCRIPKVGVTVAHILTWRISLLNCYEGMARVTLMPPSQPTLLARVFLHTSPLKKVAS